MENRSVKPWFWVFRIGLLPIFFFPASWKGVGAVVLFFATIFASLLLGLSLGVLPQHSDYFLFLVAAFAMACIVVAQKNSKDW
jgi:hypothetical protein